MKLDQIILADENLAEMLKISTSTLASWRYRGEGPPYFRVGANRTGKAFYLMNDVIAWATSRTFVSTLEEANPNQLNKEAF